VAGTKFIVLQLKQIIRTGIFALIGIAAIIALILIVVPKGHKEAAESASVAYKPGVYSARIILHNRPVSVNVTVNESEIVSVELAELSATQEVFYPLFKPTMETLSHEIVDKQTTAIIPPEDAEYTGRILLDAVDSALAKAAEAAAAEEVKNAEGGEQ
jgi:uncharacterized protein with FMN-binding domain